MGILPDQGDNGESLTTKFGRKYALPRAISQVSRLVTLDDRSKRYIPIESCAVFQDEDFPLHVLVTKTRKQAFIPIRWS
jgi:hypothetical protein